MRIAIASRGIEHQRAWADRLAAGVLHHGDQVDRIDAGATTECEVVAAWGWRVAKAYVAKGHKVLVAERGYIGDRFHWTSLAWGGLNGRGDFKVPAGIDGRRFNGCHGPDALKPWTNRERGGGYALILGQVPGDCSLAGLADYPGWLAEVAAGLKEQGFRVRFRPHPNAPVLRCGVRVVEGTLAEALAGSRLVVAYNSNAAVEAVLAGVPAIVVDRGSMAWPVAGYTWRPAYVRRPDREPWAHRLAWCQWSPRELEDGTAWHFQTI